MFDGQMQASVFDGDRKVCTKQIDQKAHPFSESRLNVFHWYLVSPGPLAHLPQFCAVKMSERRNLKIGNG